MSTFDNPDPWPNDSRDRTPAQVTLPNGRTVCVRHDFDTPDRHGRQVCCCCEFARVVEAPR